MATGGNGLSTVPVDRNGEQLLDGVEPLTDESLKAGGHRYRSCPNFTGAGILVGESSRALLAGRNAGVPVIAIACRCGAVAMVQLG